jgi:lipid-A-disaccharide synthase-like uncharacterized protein
MTLGLPDPFWTGVGFLGQAVFTARFLVQWGVSEKRRESVVPVSFWWLSLAGSVLLVVYSAVRGYPVFLLGSLISGFIYARNLLLVYYAHPERAARRRVLVPLTFLFTAFVLYAAWKKPPPTVPVPWLVAGFAGAALWSGRFVIQWFVSERAGRSVMPRAFWYVGLLGSVLLLAYSVERREPVFILGYLFPPVPYIRNLVLIYRKEGYPAPVRFAIGLLESRRTRWATISVLSALLAIFLAIRTVRSDEVAGDFLRYHRAGRMVLTGRAGHLYDKDPLFDVYEEEEYVEESFRYLPAFAVLMAPISALPPKVAEVLWTRLNTLNYALLLLVSWWLCRRFGAGAGWMWIPFLFTIRFGWDNLNLGQINPSVFALAITGVWFSETDRPLRGGLLAGLATAIKLTPGLVLVAFLCRRQFRAFGAGLGGFLLVTFLLPAAVLGPGRALSLAGEVTKRQGADLVVAEEHDEVPGESLKAMAFRILGTEPFHKHWRRIDVSLGWLTNRQALWAYRVLAAALLLWYLGFTITRRKALSVPFVWGATFATALLVSPETRQAHFLSLVLPVTALTLFLAREGVRGPGLRAVAALLGLAFLFSALPGRAIVGKRAAYLLAALCASGVATILLLVAIRLSSAVTERGASGEEGQE